MTDVIVIVKASYKNELRRLSYPTPADVRYNDLYLKLSRLFNLSDPFQLSYLGERNEINITDDNDIQAAIKYHERKVPQKPSEDENLSENPFANRAPTDRQRVIIRLVLTVRDSPPAAASVRLSFFDTSRSSSSSNANADADTDAATAATAPISASIPAPAPIFTPVRSLRGSGKQADAEAMLSSVICDVCGDIIKGTRWKCQVCKNYDLCAECKNGGHLHNSDHCFRSLHIPTVVSPTPVTQGPIHVGVICDFCKKVIRGTRWKCHDCPNYDLCQGCKSGNCHSHPVHHNFRSIQHPRQHTRPHSDSDSRSSQPFHPAQCDFCESIIKGIRHKCLQCPDFDLCNTCIELAESQHPEHSFVQIAKPGCLEIKSLNPVLHPGVRCDGCDKTIYGVRYKCGNCPDFDFCGNCEANPLTKHDATHLFIKIKRPVSVSLSDHSPLLRNFYTLPPDQPQTPRRHCSRRQSPATAVKPSPVKPSRNHPYEEATLADLVETSTDASCRIAMGPLVLEPLQTGQAAVPCVTHSTSGAESSVDDVSRTPTSESIFTVMQPVIVDTVETVETVDKVDTTRVAADPAPNQYIVFDLPPTPIQTPIPASPSTSSLNQDSPAPSSFAARFVENVNIEDGTVMEPEARFLKIWKVVNDGRMSWPEGSVLQFCGGDKCFSESFSSSEDGPKFLVPATDAGNETFITADLQAPANPGRYVSYWGLVTPDGTKFGHRFWCDIVVEELDASSASSSMIFPTINTQQVQERIENSNLPSPVFAPTAVHPNLEDIFRDSASIAPSLASSAVLTNTTNNSDDDDNMTVVSASVRSSAPSGIHIPGNEDYSDYLDDTVSSFSDISSRASFDGDEDDEGEDDDFVFVADDISLNGHRLTLGDDLEQSVQIAKAPEPLPTPCVITEEDEVEFGTNSETRPLMASNENVFTGGKFDSEMAILRNMGFEDVRMNHNLLTTFDGNLEEVITTLLSTVRV